MRLRIFDGTKMTFFTVLLSVYFATFGAARAACICLRAAKEFACVS